MDTPIAQYRKRVQDGNLFHDPAQERAAQMLTLLQGRLKNWQPLKKPTLFGRPDPEPTGLYLYGGVGRGKSMLMDLFFQCAPVAQKIRVHFQDFMRDTHQNIANWRKLSEKDRKNHPNYVRGIADDPIAPVAKGIARRANLICFDEFQVTDIADAMLLGRLFDQLFAHGIVLVATSNRPPEDLYKDGLNRQLFLPFIQKLNDRLDILDLTADRDYRQNQLQGQELYFSPLGAQASEQIDQLWQNLLGKSVAYDRKIHVQGREILVSPTFGGSARILFSDWCDQAMASADYLELASQFHTLFLENVPVRGPHNRNAATRFVWLIDALYEARVKLVVSAAAEPDELYRQGDGAFEFERCASRLMEMRSNAWAEMVHDGKGLVV